MGAADRLGGRRCGNDGRAARRFRSGANDLADAADRSGVQQHYALQRAARKHDFLVHAKLDVDGGRHHSGRGHRVHLHRTVGRFDCGAQLPGGRHAVVRELYGASGSAGISPGFDSALYVDRYMARWVAGEVRRGRRHRPAGDLQRGEGHRAGRGADRGGPGGDYESRARYQPGRAARGSSGDGRHRLRFRIVGRGRKFLYICFQANGWRRVAIASW